MNAGDSSRNQKSNRIREIEGRLFVFGPLVALVGDGAFGGRSTDFDARDAADFFFGAQAFFLAFGHLGPLPQNITMQVCSSRRKQRLCQALSRRGRGLLRRPLKRARRGKPQAGRVRCRRAGDAWGARQESEPKKESRRPAENN